MLMIPLCLLSLKLKWSTCFGGNSKTSLPNDWNKEQPEQQILLRESSLFSREGCHFALSENKNVTSKDNLRSFDQNPASLQSDRSHTCGFETDSLCTRESAYPQNPIVCQMYSLVPAISRLSSLTVTTRCRNLPKRLSPQGLRSGPERIRFKYFRFNADLTDPAVRTVQDTIRTSTHTCFNTHISLLPRIILL